MTVEQEIVALWERVVVRAPEPVDFARCPTWHESTRERPAVVEIWEREARRMAPALEAAVHDRLTQMTTLDYAAALNVYKTVMYRELIELVMRELTAALSGWTGDDLSARPVERYQLELQKLVLLARGELEFAVALETMAAAHDPDGKLHLWHDAVHETTGRRSS